MSFDIVCATPITTTLLVFSHCATVYSS